MHIKVAAIQMVSTTNIEQNMATAERLLEQAADQGAQWALLPEYWPIMGRKDTDKLAIAEPFGQGVLQTFLAATAKRLGMVIIGGTIPLQSEAENKVLNTMLTYQRDGELIGRYDKMHLFGFQGLGESYQESDTIQAGSDVPQLSVDGIGVAQGICYDVRFPEFFRAQLPFEVMVLPAAFTHTTGQAHWELLLRARAVENQCYVLASGQGGVHESGRQTWGQSMLIDPWGNIVNQLANHDGVVIGDIDTQKVQSVRSKLPALRHRCL